MTATLARPDGRTPVGAPATDSPSRSPEPGRGIRARVARTLGPILGPIFGSALGPVLGPLLAGLLGLGISLVGITTPSVWYDEAATISSSTRSWSELWLMIGNVDAVHAAYYALMHVVFDVFGYSPFTLRAPSAIAVGLAAALTVVLVRSFDRPRLALVAGLVFCLLPRTTWMGTEGRSYAISAVLAVALTWVLVRALRPAPGSRPRARWFVAYALLAVLSCVVFIYLALIVVAHAVTVALWLVARRGRAPGSPAASGPSTDSASASDLAGDRVGDRVGDPAADPGQDSGVEPDLDSGRVPSPAGSPSGLARRWAVAAVAAALVLLPFALLVRSESAQLHWIKPLSGETWRQVFVEQWFYAGTAFAVVGWVLLAVGAVALVRGRGRGLSLAIVVLPVVVVPVLALLVATVVYLPLYTPRYLSMCLPFVAIAITAGVSALRPRAVAFVALALIAALAVPQVVLQRSPEDKDDAAWSQVADLLTGERAAAMPGTRTAILYGTVEWHPSASSRVMAHAYPAAFADTIDVTLGTPAGQTGQLWETRIPLSSPVAEARLAGADVAYLVTSSARDKRPLTTALMAAEGWQVSAEWHFTDINVLRYERAAPE